MKKVVIADDHPIFRAGLRQIIEETQDHAVAAEVGDGNSCIASLDLVQPDIVTLDLALPGLDGYGVLEWIGEHMPSLTVVVISMHSSRAFAKRAKELGARAFVAKEDAASEIHNAFLTPPGIFYMSASVGGNRGAGSEPEQQPEKLDEARGRLETLTPAERRIFELVGESHTSREIGKLLGLSHRTVQTHRQRISQKLGLQGPNSLLKYAIHRQIKPDGKP